MKIVYCFQFGITPYRSKKNNLYKVSWLLFCLQTKLYIDNHNTNQLLAKISAKPLKVHASFSCIEFTLFVEHTYSKSSIVCSMYWGL